MQEKVGWIGDSDRGNDAWEILLEIRAGMTKPRKINSTINLTELL